MRIEIDKTQVYNNIMQLTAIAGRNRQNMEAIAVTEDNLPAMGIYIAEAVTEAENELRRHISKSADFTLYENTDAVVLEIKDLLRHADSTDGQIKSSLILYLTHYSVSRWVSDIEIAKDLAEPYSNSAGGYLSKLQSLVCQRDEYKVEADSYESRQEESTTADFNPLLSNPAYETRQRDVQPVDKEWPEGVIVDSENNILVSKT
jgi:hypothetical protein|nr:MAG TPA: hypothetical protein [Bacteriophage sp.]